MSAKPLNCFCVFTAGLLMLFCVLAVQGQNTAVKCIPEWVWGYELEWVTELQYNSATGRDEPQVVQRNVYKRREVCVPVSQSGNLAAPGNKKNNSSNSSISRSAETKPNSAFRLPAAGKYSGKWFSTFSDVPAQKGVWTLSFDATGKITGKEINDTFNAEADISGFINKEGNIEIIIKYGGIFKDAPLSLMKGSITNSENQRLKGILRQYRGEKVTTVIEIDLAPADDK